MSKKNRDEHDKTAAAPVPAPRWADYFWANCIFFAFLAVLLLVVRLSCMAPEDAQTPAIQYVLDTTLEFLFFLFAGGFLLVTLFDAAYEFFAGKAEAPASAEETPKA
ncbi:MAG TPA: hypothetical protein VK914_06135 [bacterium]|jgi:hypothetical protein|nr:hypothetical protein [bacterium]